MFFLWDPSNDHSSYSYVGIPLPSRASSDACIYVQKEVGLKCMRAQLYMKNKLHPKTKDGMHPKTKDSMHQ